MASEAKVGVRRYQNYINGEFCESASRKYFPVIDPSTEEIIAEVPEAEEADVNRAVAAARTAFDSGAWPQTTAQERGRILFRLAERIRKESAITRGTGGAKFRQADCRSGIRHGGLRYLL